MALALTLSHAHHLALSKKSLSDLSSAVCSVPGLSEGFLPEAAREEVVSLLCPHVCIPEIRRIVRASEGGKKKSASRRMSLPG